MLDAMGTLIAGCGWLGTALASEIAAGGERVYGIRRDPAAKTDLARHGVEPLIFDLGDDDAVSRLPDDVTEIVACLAPTSRSVEAYRETYLDGIAVLLARYGGDRSRRLVYTSSTGVFGQSDGSVVDERSPTLPRSETAELLVEAERLVLESGWGSVVRLSGLYGPGRYGVIERVRSGRLALGRGDRRWMNFCHLDDAVSTVRAALRSGEAGVVYHASDTEPARRRDVVRWIADSRGFEPKVAQDGEAGGGPDRRIDATWTRRTLGVELAFPTFRDGLAVR
jgi:nucleoside-diphosphate-sugar epimerase